MSSRSTTIRRRRSKSGIIALTNVVSHLVDDCASRLVEELLRRLLIHHPRLSSMMIFMTMKMRRLHVLALALAVPAVTRQHGHSRRGTMIPLVRITLLLLLLTTITTQTSFADDDSEKKESSRQKRFRIMTHLGGGRYDFFPLFPLSFFNKKKKTRYKKKRAKKKKTKIDDAT